MLFFWYPFFKKSHFYARFPTFVIVNLLDYDLDLQSKTFCIVQNPYCLQPTEIDIRF